MEALERDWERMVTFYQFPKEHWKHLRTTNIVESPFAGLRLRTQASKRYKKVANATAIIWKMLMVAEQRFRRLDGRKKLEQVYLGIEFKDGVQVISPGVLISWKRSRNGRRYLPLLNYYTPIEKTSFTFPL